MKVFTPVKRQVARAILVLTKHFGIPAEIYYPLSFNNKQHGFQDEDITYDEGRTLRVLIPAVFRKQNQTLELLDSFYNPGDIAYFAPNNIVHPKFSKIICKYDGAIRNFIINDIEEIKDDLVNDRTDVIFRKYILVPSNSIDIDRNRDELIDSLNKELDPATDNLIPPDESVTTITGPEVLNPAIIFDPIG